jgi:hypothetical protein
MKKRRRRARAAGEADPDEILTEYDFSHARPNKYASRYASPGEAPGFKVELQGSVPLDAEAIFTLGFSGEDAWQAFMAEMRSLTDAR